MNEQQKRVVVIAGAVILLMLVFPPWQSVGMVPMSKGYGLIFAPPGKFVEINGARLFVQILIVIIGAGIGLYLQKAKPAA